jgi:hypothetical protein
MVRMYEAQSELARQLGMSRNELRFLTQLAIGQMISRGDVPNLTRVGTSLGYDKTLKHEVMKLVPAFNKGKKIYLEK